MWKGEGYERRAKIFGIGFGGRTYGGSNPAAEPSSIWKGLCCRAWQADICGGCGKSRNFF